MGDSVVLKCRECDTVIAEKRMEWVHDLIIPKNSTIVDVTIGNREKNKTSVDLTFKCNQCSTLTASIDN
jgi:ribosomal protein L44E